MEGEGALWGQNWSYVAAGDTDSDDHSMEPDLAGSATGLAIPCCLPRPAMELIFLSVTL